MQTLNKFCCCKSYIWIIVAVRLSPCRFLNFSQDNFKASLSLGFQLKSVKQKGLKIVCQSFLSIVTQILGLLKCWPLWNLNTLSKVLQSKTKSNIRDKILMFLFLAEKTNQHFIISAHVFSYDIRLFGEYEKNLPQSLRNFLSLILKRHSLSSVTFIKATVKSKSYSKHLNEIKHSLQSRQNGKSSLFVMYLIANPSFGPWLLKHDTNVF